MIHLRHAVRIRLAISFALLIVAAVAPISAATSPNQDSVDLQVVTRIRQEAIQHSKVMQTLSDLTDRIGPRLAGSQNLKNANLWTEKQLTDWGLSNAHLEGFTFGRGWALDSISIRMTSPDTAVLLGFPKAWTPATNGVLQGEVVAVKIKSTEDFDKYKGQLAGKIVLLGEPRDLKPEAEAALHRYDDAKLKDLSEFQMPGAAYKDPTGRLWTREEIQQRRRLSIATDKFLQDEKVAASIEGSRGDEGLLFVQGTQNFKPGSPDGVLQLVIAAEQFNRMSRLLERKIPVAVELDVKSHFESPDNGQIFNTIAEIPGADKKDELVLVGGHLDSWHAGTGATDNATGVAVAMEAVRILQALKLKPRRTVRIALWAAEEEGLLGSRAYVKEHFGYPEEPKDDTPSYLRQTPLPVVLKPEQAKVSAYFNLDNGTGKIRGIYAQENASVAPLFQQWGEPFRDLGFTSVTMRNTGSTDHISFDAIGIPGFQFIQDSIEYETRTHHSNMDVYDRAQREDLIQASIVLASFIYNTATRDELLPRKPLSAEVKYEQPVTSAAVTSAKKEVKKKN
ncbi:MAG TPA: M20/M25/M40 family metallo-hydrolase [Candidatus Saccharimonadales bacterium]|nr:M20/M25/M40 family metallo-hydrolase [Candidatus Saccharimonadales bacterium]